MASIHEHETLAKREWDESYDLERDLTLWGEPPVPFVKDALEVFERRGARTLLDLPCGDGRNIIPLCQGGLNVLGVDSSERALKIARRRLDTLGMTDCLLLQADIFGTPLMSEQFDGIFCCDVLGHLREPDLALRELARLTRPGGTIVANVFAMGDSTRGDNMSSIGREEYIFADTFFFRFYDEERAAILADVEGMMCESLSLVRWMEPPHERYREYEHEHESWLLVLTKS